MANNVGFKFGTQANLNKLTSAQLVAGSFYLTSDSHRLYYAQEDGSTTSLVDLNKYIKQYATLSALPSGAEDGDFAYIAEGNIFAVYSASKAGWVQVNEQVTLQTSSDATKVAQSGDDALVTTTVKDTNNNSAVGSFKIAAGSGIKLTVKDGALTVDATGVDTQYVLGSNTSTTTGIISLKTKDGTASGSAVIKSSNSDTLGVSSDNAGNVTLDVAQQVEEVVNKFDANGKFTTTLGGVATVESEAITPTISYGNGTTKTTATFNSGTASLSVYTVEEADAKIKADIESYLQTADAMHFAGTVGAGGTTTTLPAITTVSNGTTYKVVEAGVIDGAAVGDMVIAFGTENQKTGLIDSGEWILVPSGDDQLLTGSATTEGVTLRDNANNIISGIKVVSVAGNPVTATGVVNDTQTTITVKHSALSTAAVTDGTAVSQEGAGTTATTTDITAITDMTVDDYGHVTAATKKKITLTDTHNHLTEVTTKATTISGTDNAINVTTTVGSEDETKSGSYSLSSTSLEVKADSGNAVVNLVWGTF
jgi:hypothetical protein